MLDDARTCQTMHDPETVLRRLQKNSRTSNFNILASTSVSHCAPRSSLTISLPSARFAIYLHMYDLSYMLMPFEVLADTDNYC